MQDPGANMYKRGKNFSTQSFLGIRFLLAGVSEASIFKETPAAWKMQAESKIQYAISFWKWQWPSSLNPQSLMEHVYLARADIPSGSSTHVEFPSLCLAKHSKVVHEGLAKFTPFSRGNSLCCTTHLLPFHCFDCATSCGEK